MVGQTVLLMRTAPWCAGHMASLGQVLHCEEGSYTASGIHFSSLPPPSPSLSSLPHPRATTRNAQISRTKVQEGEEASAQLQSASVAFTKAALVYSMQINDVQLKKGHEIQDRVRTGRRRGGGRGEERGGGERREGEGRGGRGRGRNIRKAS